MIGARRINLYWKNHAQKLGPGCLSFSEYDISVVVTKVSWLCRWGEGDEFGQKLGVCGGRGTVDSKKQKVEHNRVMKTPGGALMEIMGSVLQR